MPSVDSMMGLISKIDSPFVTVHQNRCILVRNRNADCLRCASVCTSGCIHYDEEAQQLAITPDKCIGCGTCATNCPTCCLEAHHPNDAELYDECAGAARANDDTVVIACGELLDRARGLVDEEKAARVECLGRVEESLLTTLASEGASKIVLVSGNCEHCDHNTGRDMAESVVETERALLDAWGGECEVRISSKLPKSVRKDEKNTFDASKRKAFLETKREGMRVGAVAAEQATESFLSGTEEAEKQASVYVKTMEDGTLPHFLPDRRERLLDALATIGEPKDVMIETRLWGHVIIDTDKCQSCQMCAVFCPTGALRKFGDPDSGEPFGVEHYPGDCVKCRCCTNICPAGALELSEEVFAQDMIAGMTDRYVMKQPAVKKNTAHTIWHTAQTMFNIEEVYER